ncbi:pyrimidine reductase family protein [Nocardia salmonicida]|uniref:pyrimidine reductase family protein n=1 Tax=Nocardia salmonicida TaxID=53431 RepID=UPI0007A3A194|nr:pyrimidine reductase family protein [Nocardia salmonicida]
MTEPQIISGQRELGDDELIQLYQGPRSGPWVRANFVQSVDGAIALGETSSGLTTPLDQRILKLLRLLSDVVLVGASTIRAEDYIGVRFSDAGVARRRAWGMTDAPPLAVVSGRADLDPNSRLLTDTLVPPIILTTRSASAAAKSNLKAAGATVLELGDTSIESGAIIEALADLGLRQIICEGGPTLAGQLATDHVLDELCLTTVPIILGGPAGRVMHGRLTSLPVQCQHIIVDQDGAQIARWIKTPNHA